MSCFKAAICGLKDRSQTTRIYHSHAAIKQYLNSPILHQPDQRHDRSDSNHHIYIAASDLARSEIFYDRVLLDTLGFSKKETLNKSSVRGEVSNHLSKPFDTSVMVRYLTTNGCTLC